MRLRRRYSTHFLLQTTPLVGKLTPLASNGITATGEPDANELYPNDRMPAGMNAEATCLELYRQFVKKPTEFILESVRMAKKSSLASPQQIEAAILSIRGEKVLLDADLAALYGVTTKALVQAVQRNISRFPEDFAFRLTTQEFAALRSQIVTSEKPGRGGRRYPPLVFTEQGVAMLSSVLRSQQAVAVNIEIMRSFAAPASDSRRQR